MAHNHCHVGDCVPQQPCAGGMEAHSISDGGVEGTDGAHKGERGRSVAILAEVRIRGPRELRRGGHGPRQMAQLGVRNSVSHIPQSNNTSNKHIVPAVAFPLPF